VLTCAWLCVSVREDVAWVNEHCGARTTRARKICRAYGADKMARALHKVIRRQLSQRFQQWKDTYHFSVDQVSPHRGSGMEPLLM
jgi:hypothetical protein